MEEELIKLRREVYELTVYTQITQPLMLKQTCDEIKKNKKEIAEWEERLEQTKKMSEFAAKLQNTSLEFEATVLGVHGAKSLVHMQEEMNTLKSDQKKKDLDKIQKATKKTLKKYKKSPVVKDIMHHEKMAEENKKELEAVIKRKEEQAARLAALETEQREGENHFILQMLQMKKENEETILKINTVKDLRTQQKQETEDIDLQISGIQKEIMNYHEKYRELVASSLKPSEEDKTHSRYSNLSKRKLADLQIDKSNIQQVQADFVKPHCSLLTGGRNIGVDKGVKKGNNERIQTEFKIPTAMKPTVNDDIPLVYKQTVQEKINIDKDNVKKVRFEDEHKMPPSDVNKPPIITQPQEECNVAANPAVKQIQIEAERKMTPPDTHKAPIVSQLKNEEHGLSLDRHAVKKTIQIEAEHTLLQPEFPKVTATQANKEGSASVNPAFDDNFLILNAVPPKNPITEAIVGCSEDETKPLNKTVSSERETVGSSKSVNERLNMSAEIFPRTLSFSSPNDELSFMDFNADEPDRSFEMKNEKKDNWFNFENIPEDPTQGNKKKKKSPTLGFFKNTEDHAGGFF